LHPALVFLIIFYLQNTSKSKIMFKSKNLFYLLLAVTISFSSCKKDEEEEDPTTPTASAPANPIPAPAGADGALVAVHTATYIDAPFVGEIYQPIGLGVAVFGNLSSGSFVNAGTVSLNSNNLAAQSNNSYVYTPSATSVSGIDLSSNIDWNVSGGNGFGAFTASPSNEIPSGPKYSGATTIARTSAFTLSSSTEIISADSTIFSVISPTNTLIKVVAGNVQSVEFSAAEMGTLGAGSGYVQITPYNYELQTLGGKQICLINEAVNTTGVTFQ
jgi:hypothetical protein